MSTRTGKTPGRPFQKGYRPPPVPPEVRARMSESQQIRRAKERHQRIQRFPSGTIQV